MAKQVTSVEYGLEKIFSGAQDFLPLLGTDYSCQWLYKNGDRLQAGFNPRTAASAFYPQLRRG